MDVSRIPMTHGMEVEQFNVPSGIRHDEYDEYWGDWHTDPSGPVETEFGPGKQVKRLIDEFNDTALQYGDFPWEWTASDGSSGAGSHVHFNVERLENDEDTVTAWTIAYNTIIDLLPVMAPFFAHNWEEGFRDRTYYRGSELNIEHWASPQTGRKSADSIREHYQNPGRTSRTYHSVTLNPGYTSGGKPLTLELRLSDSHPAFALTGCYFLRKIVKWCLERDWSVKIDRDASDTNNVLDVIYQRVYDIPSESNMLRELQKPLTIVFEEGREVPGLDTKYDSPWALLKDIIIELKPRWDDTRADSRVCELLRYAGKLVESRKADPFVNQQSQIPHPGRNPHAIWRVHKKEFEWECGPS